MAKYPYMKWYPLDYAAKTGHLTLEEDGFYRRMLDYAWLRGDIGLPANPTELARLLKLDGRVVRRILPRMADFWTERDGKLFNGRIEEDRRILAVSSEKQSDNAKARWLKTKKTADAVAMPNHSHSQNIEDSPPMVPPKKPSPRKTQLREETLPISWRAYCTEKRPDLDPEATFENFRDYWLGKGGVMADWKRTWHRWVRNQHENTRASVNGSTPTKTDRAKAAILRGLDSIERRRGGPQANGGDPAPMLPDSEVVWAGTGSSGKRSGDI